MFNDAGVGAKASGHHAICFFSLGGGVCTDRK